MQEVKRMRNERGLSQQALADLAGINKVTLIRIEHGTGNPNVETLEKLARALGVEVADFFPKAQAPLPLEDREAGHQERERLLCYLKTSEGLIRRMRRRWEAAAEENTFSYEAWSEAAETVTDLQDAFVEAVPVEVYATGEQRLPSEEWEALASVLGGLSMLRDDLLVAYAVRFEVGGAPPDTKDELAVVRERKRQLEKMPELLGTRQESNTA